MAAMLQQVFLCFALLATAAAGLRVNERLAAAGAGYAAAWHSEYRLRLCSRLAAASRNLAEAAVVLGEPAAGSAAAQLTAELQLPYAARDWPDTDGACTTPTPSSSLPVVDGSVLYLQRHDGQPIPWPNWVARYRSHTP